VPTVTVFTAERMQEIEDNAIVDGVIDGSGHLILEKNDGTPVDAGPVISAAGTPYVGQYTTAGRPSASGLGAKIYWDIDQTKFYLSNNTTWEVIDFLTGTGEAIGQFITADRPSAVGLSGKILWDVTEENFYKSNGTIWEAVVLGGGDVTLSQTSIAAADWVLQLADPVGADDTKVPSWSKAKNYIDSVAIPAQVASTDTDVLDIYTSGNITYFKPVGFSGGGGSAFADNVFEIFDNGDTANRVSFTVSGSALIGLPSADGVMLTDNNSVNVLNKILATSNQLTGQYEMFGGKFKDFMLGGLDFTFGSLQTMPPNCYAVIGGPAKPPTFLGYMNGANSTTDTAVGSGVDILKVASRPMNSSFDFASVDSAKISFVTAEVPSSAALGTDIRLAVCRIGSITIENIFGVQAGNVADSTLSSVFVRNAMVIGANSATTKPATGYAAEFKHASQAFGYGVGAGSAVTQLTSKTTASPAITTPNGTVTTHSQALPANTTVSFVLSNANISANDHVEVTHVPGGTLPGTVGAYYVFGVAAAGSATIYIRNLTAGSLTENLVLRYHVIKGSVT
jgi:hypothetical protein